MAREDYDDAVASVDAPGLDDNAARVGVHQLLFVSLARQQCHGGSVQLIG